MGQLPAIAQAQCIPGGPFVQIESMFSSAAAYRKYEMENEDLTNKEYKNYSTAHLAILLFSRWHI